ncbi:hypothetical protein Taro_022198 [Colocasia esculenta]|uniref:Uncharacterized protein n=1 Tax=Colocasia esculenta TaxID=4460 RepID=A0A843V0T9_COLES|nr:hypothetical protein [Colocasia esculenta]
MHVPVLELAGVVWRSSWWLESRRSSISSSSSSPVHLLRPAQTTFLKPIKDSLASLASSIPIPLGRSSETVSVQRLRVPSHVDPWFTQLESPSLRVHALSKEPEIDLEDGHPWYFDIENFLKDGSFPDYATSADRRAIRRVSEHYKIIGGVLYKKSLSGGQLDLIRLSMVENIKKARGSLQYQGFHAQSSLLMAYASAYVSCSPPPPPSPDAGLGEKVSTPSMPRVVVAILAPRMGLPMTQCHQETHTLTRSSLPPPDGPGAAAPGASSAPGSSKTPNPRQPELAPQWPAPGPPRPVSVSPSPRVGDPPSSSNPTADSPSVPGGSPPLPAATHR